MTAVAAGRPWLASYPKQVPHEIDLAKVGTLADLFETAVSRFAERPSYESFGKAITYAELGRQAKAFAAWLQAKGLKKGDRVAIMLPNVLAYPVALFGVLAGGFTVVNVNPLYTARELTHQLNDSGARVLVVLENFAHVVQEAAPNLTLDHVLVATPGDLMGVKGLIVNLVARKVKKVVPPYDLPKARRFAEALREGAGLRFADPKVTQDDVAFLQYTGGTTGVAKGAVLTHRNVAANVAQAAAALGWSLEGEPNHVMVTALPLYHILALTCCAIFMATIGAKCLLIANPRDIPGFIKTIKSARITIMTGVNTLYNALANHPDIGTVDFSHLRFSVSGGMATQAAVAARWKALTGKAIVEGYGLSETSPVASVNRPDLAEFSGTIGYPVPSTDISIRSVDTGVEVEPGREGEICIKGPQVMAGYWNRPDETAKVMTADGYFRSGDIGIMLPDGQIKIVDRMKDMVLVSGFNVYPNEVEDVIALNPKVLEAAVVGAPDENSGEVVVAHVVRKDPSLTAEELREHCRAHLTGYKVPRHIIFRDALPKTNVGKVLRRALRDDARPPA